MLKKRETLGFVKRPIMSDKDINEVEAQLKKTSARQLELGLGDSAAAIVRAVKSMKDLRVFERSKEVAVTLQKQMGLSFVQSPGEEFVRFGSRVQPVTKLPEFAMVQLVKETKAISCRLENREYKANIPLIPGTVLELAKRCKDIAPKGKFHILYMPSWEQQPQRDPVLLFEIARRFAVVGAWDKDADVIKEFLVPEKK